MCNQHKGLVPIKVITRSLDRRGYGAVVRYGAAYGSGRYCIFVSTDNVDPVHLIPQLFEKEETFLQKLFSNSYHALIRRFAIPGYPAGGFDFFLVDRLVVNEVNKIHEKNTNLMTLVFWLGFQAVFIPYVHQRRTRGVSRWTLGKKLKLFVNTFVSFSYFPICLFSFLGIVYAIISFSYGAFIFISWLSFGFEIQGWVPMMMVLTYTAGLQMTLLRILGKYLWRPLDEARGRSQFVIDRVYGDAKTDQGT